MKLILYILIFCFILKKFFWRPKPGQAHLSVFFGIPGAGKTTVAAWFAKIYNKRKIPVFSNVCIKDTYKVEADEIGKYLMCETPSLFILDEASVEFNNRNYKAMPQQVIKYFKYHRHFHQEIIVFSQSYEDFDITIRRLAYKLFLLKRSKIPFFIKLVPIKRGVGINEQTHRPDDIYEFYPWFLGWLYNRRIFAPAVWNDFNSWEQYELPQKNWEKYPDKVFDRSGSGSKVKYFLNLWRSKAKKFSLKSLKKK